MKFNKLSSCYELRKYISKKFPKLSVANCSLISNWDEFRVEIHTGEIDIHQDIKYKIFDEYYEVSTRTLNNELREFQKEYEEQVKRNTEAKFKYQILKMLVQPFSKTELDDELVFQNGNIQTDIILKYKNVKYCVDICELFQPNPIEDLLVYELDGDNYSIGIPIYEFVNDTDNSIKKLKQMVSNINDCCLEYYHRKEKLDGRYMKLFRQLDSEKQTKIETLSNWKEN